MAPGRAGAFRLVALALLLAGLACARGAPAPAPTLLPPPTPVVTPSPPPARPPALRITGRAERPSYRPDEVVTLTVEVEALEPADLPRFPLPLTLRRLFEGEPVARVPGGGPRRLEEGERAGFTVRIPPPEGGFPTGRYTAYVRYGGPEPAREGVADLGLLFSVVPPQGALTGEVTVGQTQEARGVRITLLRVLLTEKEVRVEARAVPEGYRMDRSFGPVGRPHIATASYRLDDGPQVFAGGAINREEEEGIYLAWTLDPVPVGVQTLHFVVERLDDTEGPWAWKVPLP